MNNKSVLRILLILLILAAILLPRFYCQNMTGTQPAAKPGAKMPIKVGVFVVQNESFSNAFAVSGNILANEQVDLKCETSGLINKLSINEGNLVQKGQLLLKINDADLQAQLKKAYATKKLKEETEKRNKTLLAKEAISQQDYDISTAELSSINADIDLIKEQIRRTELKAPFAGMIGLRSVSEGAFITTSNVIATLQDIQKVKLEFSVPEKYALSVQKGEQVSFSINGSEKLYNATVYAIEPNINEQTRTVLMRAICNNNARTLLPGSFANVNIKLPVSKNAFLIPTQAMVPVLKGQKVFVVQGDSAVEKMIKTGFRNEEKIEVTEGLQAGDTIIVEGIMYIKNGSKIKLKSGK